MAQTEMAYPPGLVLHGRTYRVQKRVPKDCVGHYDKPILYFKTVHTTKQEAAPAAWAWIAECEAEFERIRKTGSKLMATISDEDVKRLADLWTVHILEEDEEVRFEGLGEHQYQDALTTNAIALEGTRQDLARGNWQDDWLLFEMNDFVEAAGYRLDKDSEAYKALAIAFLKATATAFEAIKRRNQGAIVETPAAPVLTPTGAARRHPKRGSCPSLGKLVERFLSEADHTKPMFKKYNSVLPLLVELIGDKPCEEMKQLDLTDFCRALCRLPPRWRDMVRQKKATVKSLVEMEHGQTISPKTYEDTYIAALRPFLKDAILTFGDQGFPRHLTFDGVKYSGREEAAQNKQRPFTAQELKALFEGEHLTKARSSPDTEHEFWLPFVGLFTGAWVNEVCQLNPQTDIRQEEGIWIFDITDESGTDERVRKSVKNTVSKRLVPIHDKLVEAGFLTYVGRMKEAGAKLLFPQWAPSMGTASAGAREWFSELLKRLGLRDDTPGRKLTGYHAFRHTMENRAYNLEVFSIGAITGHAENVSKVQRGYRDVLDIGVKKRVLDRISFDLELT